MHHDWLSQGVTFNLLCKLLLCYIHHTSNLFTCFLVPLISQVLSTERKKSFGLSVVLSWRSRSWRSFSIAFRVSSRSGSACDWMLASRRWIFSSWMAVECCRSYTAKPMIKIIATTTSYSSSLCVCGGVKPLGWNLWMKWTTALKASVRKQHQPLLQLRAVHCSHWQGQRIWRPLVQT